MAGKATTKKSIKEKTVKKMKELGVYKKEYDDIIDIYSELLEAYIKLHREFKEDDFSYSDETAAGGLKKNPLVSTLEALRRDILNYSDRLCLNPRALMSGKPTSSGKSKNALERALSSIG